MYNFIKLVRNENMKLHSKKNVWFMYGLLILFIVVSAIINVVSHDTFTNSSDNSKWRTDLEQENLQLNQQIQEDSRSAIAQMNRETIAMNNYRLEHNISPDDNSIWKFVLKNRINASFISLFTIIIAAGIVSSEYNLGTIKLLLIRPVSRTKILFSKYIAVLVFTLICLAVLFVISSIIGAILYGFNNPVDPYIYIQNGIVKETPLISYVLLQYLFSFVNLIVIMTFAFMMSTVFINSSLGIGLSLFLMFTGNSIVAFFSKYSWVKYILFAHTDLNQHFMGQTVVKGIDLQFSLIILLVYLGVFMLLAWLFFTKREITI